MFRTLLWILIGISTAWLIWQRVQKGSPLGAIGAILGIAAAVYVGLALMLFVFQSRLVYMPLGTIDRTPGDLRLAYEEVRIATPDGQTLAAWYLPADDAEYTVLFCHGNAGNISHRLDTLAVFHDLGLDCLIFDYRGYGHSTGRPTEEGTIIDALAALRWLVESKETSPEDIIFFGRSLGGAVAAQAVARLAETPPAGLVIESSFTSIPDLGAALYPWLPVRWFARFSYDTVGALASIHCPVLIFHSPDDEMIPFAMGRRLYEAARPPKRFAELQGTHNEGFIDNLSLYQRLWAEAIQFITDPTPPAAGRDEMAGAN